MPPPCSVEPIVAAGNPLRTPDQPHVTTTISENKANPHRDRLVAFYKKHNPSKLDTVDSTLLSYQGRETLLFEKLEKKYNNKFKPPQGNGPICFMEFEIGGQHVGIVRVKLYHDQAPLACDNFRALCTGKHGIGRSGKPLCFRNSTVHRVVPNFCIQGGDFTRGDGTGGESIYKPNSRDVDMWGNFRDEVFMQHNRKGLLSMANNGPDRNRSQFFFTLRALPSLDGKHVVFGEVVDGIEVLDKIAAVATDNKQRPLERVVIVDCGDASAASSEALKKDDDAGSSSSFFSFGVPKVESKPLEKAFASTSANDGASSWWW